MKQLKIFKQKRVKESKEVVIYRNKQKFDFLEINRRVWTQYQVCASLKEFELQYEQYNEGLDFKFLKILIRETSSNVLATVIHLGTNNVLYSGSAGKGRKFKGTERNSTYASEVLGMNVGKFCVEKGVKDILLSVISRLRRRTRGVLKGLIDSGLKFSLVEFKIYKAHNGCRPCKKTRG